MSAGNLGVMIVKAEPADLAQVAGEIANAEPNTRMKLNAKTGTNELKPYARKSEIGAIKWIELYGPTDKRNSSVKEAVY